MDRNMHSGILRGLDDPSVIEKMALSIELDIYAINSGDRELVDWIITDRRPSSIEHLEALHKEFRSTTMPLQNGAL